ncbi:flagellar basal body rod protein [Paenibacillus sp. CAA11]|uniref:flagellar hook-basal body protein n=1 Tax=Paenibacillus sp. CAA11 TaxID=1532905 RepID=UPI000D3426E5|nr:flagellar hook-basal body protein [Paenibacillus sp. CAA11]AWB46263.1 flagellar basal body rod protein [Paenibacillus sp. CAA11]
MLRGLYTAAAGMMTQQRLHDTVTQNISNINTTGYKQVNSVARSFPEMLISMVGGNEPGVKRIGKLNTGVFAEESLSSFTQGVVRDTGRSSDFALVSNLELQDPATGQNYTFDANGKYVGDDGTVVYQPQAFFTVRDADGKEKYTRDGSFHVNAAGQLLTAQGYEVLDANGNPITLPAGTSMDQISVDGQGVLRRNGNAIGQLRISEVTLPNQLVRDGHGVFEAQDAQAAGVRALAANDPAFATAEVRQGSLETSNVDTAQAMVDLLAAQKAYEANQQVIQYYDKSLDKAVNDLGRV